MIQFLWDFFKVKSPDTVQDSMVPKGAAGGKGAANNRVIRSKYMDLKNNKLNGTIAQETW